MTQAGKTDAAVSQRGATLVESVRALVPAMQGRASGLDRDEAFPRADLAALAAAGLLVAPLPQALGGLGAGTEPDGAWLIRTLLVLCGRGNPAVARLFEAHVNALRLVVRFGNEEQARLVAQDTLAGHLFGLWVTDPPGNTLHLDGGRLWGRKGPSSGAGHCSRAVVTAVQDGASRLVLIELAGDEQVAATTGLHGMRAARNGIVTLDGVSAAATALIGQPGDYLREPDFSCGAWRGSAAALGALEAMVEAARTELLRRGHAGAPLQQARFGQVCIASETARLWVERAAEVAERSGDPAAQVAYVNLARIAVETACLDGIRDIQRSLGLGAFVAPHPVERLARDLATYLRQPAPDAVLTEAAEHYLRRAPC